MHKIIRYMAFVGSLVGAYFVSYNIAYAPNVTVGIIVLPAKGEPLSHHIKPYVNALRDEGYEVILLEMPWSYLRFKDTYEGALTKIAKEVATMREKGIKKVFVTGHSIGANVAIGYTAAYKNVDGILAVAPGHTPEWPAFQAKLKGSTERARQMVQDGKGEDKGNFYDFNQGKQTLLDIPARLYLSWFDPDGPAVIPKNIKNIGNIPIFWVVGSKDSIHTKKGGKNYAFNSAPSNPLNKYVVVKGGHFETPKFAPEFVIPWIEKVVDN